MTCCFQGAQTPGPSACGVSADCRLHKTWMMYLTFSCVDIPGRDLQVRIFEDFEDEQCGSPATTWDFQTTKGSNAMVLRCFYLIMEPCRGGDLLERADGVGKKWWMRGFIFGFIRCWTGCFQVFQLGLFNGSLDCSICSWHIELSMEMTCQIRKLSHSCSNLQLFLASACNQQMIQTQNDKCIYHIYIYTYIYIYNIIYYL